MKTKHEIQTMYNQDLEKLKALLAERKITPQQFSSQLMAMDIGVILLGAIAERKELDGGEDD
jgi:hypothetical protein